jgi:trk system potassium uptake protein TrkA
MFMKVIIIGCGRVGASLAHRMSERGDRVTIIDSDPAAFERLGPTFKGRTLFGVGFDRDVLIQAGIERADALAAVSASDEANVTAARLARQVFKVPRVAARVYDPRKAEIYRRLGIQTISPVAISTDRLADLLGYSPLIPSASLGTGEVDLVEVDIPQQLIGYSISELNSAGEFQLVALTREGRTFLSVPGMIFREGDLAHVAVQSASMERLKSLLGL